jgi:hypothetical protein
VLGGEGFGNVAGVSRDHFSVQHEAKVARGDGADGTAAAQPPQAVNNRQQDYVVATESMRGPVRITEAEIAASISEALPPQVSQEPDQEATSRAESGSGIEQPV